MDSDSVKTLGALALRRAFTVLGAWLAAKGLIHGDTSGFVGACMIIAEVLYEAWTRYGTVLVNAQLAKLRGVHPSQVKKQAVKSTVPPAVIAFFVFASAVAFAFSFPSPASSQVPWGKAQKPVFSKPVATPVATKPAVSTSTALTTTQVQQNPILLLQQFTVSDLQAALADAQAQNPPDAVSIACYSALIPLVQSGVANPLPAGPGLFQALQKARDAKALIANLNSPTGPLAALNTACAPLILDAQNTLLGLGISVGLVSTPAGAATTLAGVPAAIAAFLAALPK